MNLDLAWQAIAASLVNSFVHETEGQLILNVSYDIGFTIELALKNLGFVSQFSKDLACHLSELIRSNRFLKKEKKTYGGEAQSTQVVKLLEDALNTNLRADRYPPTLTWIM